MSDCIPLEEQITKYFVLKEGYLAARVATGDERRDYKRNRRTRERGKSNTHQQPLSTCHSQLLSTLDIFQSILYNSNLLDLSLNILKLLLSLQYRLRIVCRAATE